jgi:hypothetical protein
VLSEHKHANATTNLETVRYRVIQYGTVDSAVRITKRHSVLYRPIVCTDFRDIELRLRQTTDYRRTALNSRYGLGASLRQLPHRILIDHPLSAPVALAG